MNKIIVKHSSIVINNYNLGDCPRLEYFFSIYNPVYHTTVYKAIEYIEETKTLIIPRGIDISYLENLLGDTAYIDYSNDKYDYIENVKIKSLPRDEVQKEALRFILGEDQYKYTKSRSQISLNLNTGAGKTYLTIAAISFLSIKSMVITSSIDWLNQWRDRIIEYTNTKPDEIYMLIGSPSIAMLLDGRKDISKYKFILASHGTIKSYGDTYGWNKITEFFKATKIGMKVYDEAHLNFDNIAKIDAYTNTFKTVYLTATPKRSAEDEDAIYRLYFKNVPAIDLFDEDKDPRSQYIAFRYNSHPTPMDVTNCKNQFGFDRNKYISYVVDKDNFYKILTYILNIVKYRVGKTLIFIGINDAIETVREWIIYNYPELCNDVGIYTSLTDKEYKANELNKKIILSTTKSCGAAVDIKGLRYVVVLAEPFKSEVIARQSLGRLREYNTSYIDVVDDGFYYTKKYYNQKKPIYSKYATNCSEVTFNDNTLDQQYYKILAERERMMFPVTFIDKTKLKQVVTFKTDVS